MNVLTIRSYMYSMFFKISGYICSFYYSIDSFKENIFEYFLVSFTLLKLYPGNNSSKELLKIY